MEGVDIDFGNLKDVRILKDLWEVYYNGIMDFIANGKVDKDHPSPFPQPDECADMHRRLQEKYI